MKKLAPLVSALAAMAASTAMAQTTLYQEYYTGGSGTLSSVGWAASGPSGFYSGTYTYTITNSATMQAIPGQTGVYIGSEGSGSQQLYGFTTLDTSGAGSGAVAYSDISLSANPSLQFSILVSPTALDSDVLSGYFLVQNGGQWYATSAGIGIPTFTSTTEFTPESVTLTSAATAANWKTVSGIGTSTITIGAVAGANLAGNITGVGFLEGNIAPVGDYNGLNYADFLVATPEPVTCALLGLGGLAMFGTLRRRNAE